MTKGAAGAASVVLYAADLDELRAWVGCKDERRFQQAWQVVREESESEWEPQEMEVLERLLRRVVFEGKLYEGLAPEERYYLTQLLIDLLDEFVEPDPLSEDIPLDRLLKAVEGLPRGSESARLAGWLVRGRELGGDGVLWDGGPVEEVLSYFGYVTRTEVSRLAAAPEGVSRGTRAAPDGLIRLLQSSAEECARAELDLVSFVG